MVKQRLNSTHSRQRYEMEMSGMLHDPPSLPQRVTTGRQKKHLDIKKRGEGRHLNMLTLMRTHKRLQSQNLYLEVYILGPCYMIHRQLDDIGLNYSCGCAALSLRS
jgi:hypothetical protein